MARPTKARAIERIQKALDEIRELEKLQYGSFVFKKWRRDTRVALIYIFGEGSNHAKEFMRISFHAPALPVVVDLEVQQPYIDNLEQASYAEGLTSAFALLSSMLDEVKEQWPDEDRGPTPVVRGNQEVTTDDVFVVHGRDEGAKEMVARFLERLGLQPIILAEQPSQGLTIIEKFERHANVAFAVILLTPDDTGSLRDEGATPNPRPRQNVVFELGFFIGRLGRDRVCALTKGDVEIPSDYSGVLYIPYDDYGGWQARLIGELQAAGFTVDANRAIGQ